MAGLKPGCPRRRFRLAPRFPHHRSEGTQPWRARARLRRLLSGSLGLDVDRRGCPPAEESGSPLEAVGGAPPCGDDLVAE